MTKQPEALQAADALALWGLHEKANAVRRLHEVNVELLEALGKYADLDNWNKDQSGVERVWLEPDSSTRAAYSGYYSARLAITKAIKSVTGETE
jgi:hypothetical protein